MAPSVQAVTPHLRPAVALDGAASAGTPGPGHTVTAPGPPAEVPVSRWPGLAEGLRTGAPVVVRDLGICLAVPAGTGAGEPAGLVTIESASDAGPGTGPHSDLRAGPDPARVVALEVLAAAVHALWLAEHPRPTPAADALLRELATAGEGMEPPAVVQLACRRLARAAGAVRVSVFAEDEPGLVRLRRSVLPDGSSDEAAFLAADTAVATDPAGPTPVIVAQVLTSGRPATATYDPSGAGDWWTAALGVASGVAVPLGERAVMVLDGDHADAFGPADVELAAVVADHLREAAIAIRRRRESLEHEATASALRQLLEAGVRACSPMEAAEALAAAAIKVIGLPTACAYLVDADGMISEVATVGATAAKADALRAGLIGKAAAGSPVWRRTVEGEDPGPDLIPDTAVAGLVRPGGVAEVLGLRSLATIPLLSSDGPLGLVLCGGPEPRRQWRARDRQMLAQLALEGTVVVDNARLREAERHEANHDPLTGLLNRRAFTTRFREELATPRPTGQPLSVLVLDLDRFKEVNDHLGHHYGDLLLVEISRRLRASCRAEDVLARLGGDEFAVVVGCDGGTTDASTVAARIKAALDAPVVLGESTVRIEASIGIAFAPDHGDAAADLLRRADLAMYTAKRSGRGAQVWHPELRSPTSATGLLADLRSA